MKIKLQQKINIISGSLITRLKQVDDGEMYNIYDQNRLAMDNDVLIDTKENYRKVTIDQKCNATKVYGGEIVLNMMSGECVIVSNINNPMILPYNYVILEPKSTDILKEFIVFWFSYSDDAKNQIDESLQGSTKVKKMSLQSLKSFEIEVPELSKQKVISKILEKRKDLKRLQQKKELLERKKMSLVLKELGV
ncbi:TPA: restriction endonuclease subunit S [Staphylococcus aureus]|nr:restriction endonuclease subunit S [Staphylococcus aureus]MDG6616946.1 restriction endonuclease subunit S [Staphylococcus aureus]MDG6622259.1 restriction endonuclease subunit S [Staphylococcus aureus]NHE44175.1 hypothetical protein [Staphylococcus aureus]HDG2601331.1 restriction endonuclease subunit S [Staphylococcus aureus]